MQKRLLLFLEAAVVSVVLSLTAGCSSLSASHEQTSDKGVALSDILKDPENLQAIQKGSRMLKACQTGDADEFLDCLPADIREKFGTAEFTRTRNAIQETMGTITSYEYLTMLDSPLFKTHLWKVHFKREGTLEKDKVFTQDTLFRIVTGNLDGKTYIVTFGFL